MTTPNTTPHQRTWYYYYCGCWRCHDATPPPNERTQYYYYYCGGCHDVTYLSMTRFHILRMDMLRRAMNVLTSVCMSTSTSSTSTLPPFPLALLLARLAPSLSFSSQPQDTLLLSTALPPSPPCSLLLLTLKYSPYSSSNKNRKRNVAAPKGCLSTPTRCRLSIWVVVVLRLGGRRRRASK